MIVKNDLDHVVTQDRTQTGRLESPLVTAIDPRFDQTCQVSILHLIETGGPGGAERMLLELTRHLGPDYRSVIGLLKTGWLQAQVASLQMPHVMLTGGLLGDMSVLVSLLRAVREYQIGLIHAHEFYMSSLGAILSRLTGIPLIATVHGKNYYPEKRRRRVLYRMVAAQAAAMVAVSGDLKEFFCAQTGLASKNMRVIYNGIDTQRVSCSAKNRNLLDSLGIPAGSSVIGTLGNLYPVKGHIYLIRAAHQVLRIRPNTHVIILGRGNQREILLAEAQAVGIQDNVHLIGYRDDAYQWLGNMDIFVLPSLSEGTPLSLLEAMAAARPLVVTNVGGMPEIVRDGKTGFLVPPGNPEALAERILFLLDNPHLGTEMGHCARRHVCERFSVQRMVTEYSALYKEALTPVAAQKAG